MAKLTKLQISQLSEIKATSNPQDYIKNLASAFEKHPDMYNMRQKLYALLLMIADGKVDDLFYGDDNSFANGEFVLVFNHRRKQVQELLKRMILSGFTPINGNMPSLYAGYSFVDYRYTSTKSELPDGFGHMIVVNVYKLSFRQFKPNTDKELPIFGLSRDYPINYSLFHDSLQPSDDRVVVMAEAEDVVQEVVNALPFDVKIVQGGTGKEILEVSSGTYFKVRPQVSRVVITPNAHRDLNYDRESDEIAKSGNVVINYDVAKSIYEIMEKFENSIAVNTKLLKHVNAVVRKKNQRKRIRDSFKELCESDPDTYTGLSVMNDRIEIADRIIINRDGFVSIRSNTSRKANEFIQEAVENLELLQRYELKIRKVQDIIFNIKD